MARQVVWSEPAWGDLKRIVDLLAGEAPEEAMRFARHGRRSARSLAEQPDQGGRVPHLERPEMRELPLGDYRLLYQVEEERVVVHGLIHRERDLAALWHREGRPPSV